MSDLPPHFIADVRHPRGYPDLDVGRWFQWRSIPMIELSCAGYLAHPFLIKGDQQLLVIKMFEP